MASITIRNLDETLHAKLQVLAAQAGHSIEEEARLILHSVLDSQPSSKGLGTQIHQRFEGLGGCDLPAVKREAIPSPSVLGEL